MGRIRSDRNTLESFCNLNDCTITFIIEEHIKKTVNGSRRIGQYTSHRILKPFDNGCVVTQAYIPRMDRFNLIIAGSAVAP